MLCIFFYRQAAVSAPNAFAAGSQNHQAVRNKAKTNVDLILFCFVYFFFFAGNSQWVPLMHDGWMWKPAACGLMTALMRYVLTDHACLFACLFSSAAASAVCLPMPQWRTPDTPPCVAPIRSCAASPAHAAHLFIWTRDTRNSTQLFALVFPSSFFFFPNL